MDDLAFHIFLQIQICQRCVDIDVTDVSLVKGQAN